MQREITTKVTVRGDYPTSITSVMYGANIDVLAFNHDFIMKRDPALGIQILELYKKARDLADKRPLSKNSSKFLEAHDAMLDKLFGKDQPAAEV